MMAGIDGYLCIHIACKEGHFKLVRYLSDTWGKELVMRAENEGCSCLHIACQNRRLEIVQYLSETWGRELVMMTDSQGHSCLDAAGTPFLMAMHEQFLEA